MSDSLQLTIDENAIVTAWNDQACAESSEPASHHAWLEKQLPSLLSKIATQVHGRMPLPYGYGLDHWEAGWDLNRYINDIEFLREETLKRLPQLSNGSTSKGSDQLLSNDDTHSRIMVARQRIRNAYKAAIEEVQRAAALSDSAQHSSHASNLLTSVVRSCQDAIIVMSPAGTIQTWNHGAEKIYGHKDRDAIGKHASLIIPSKRVTELHDLLRKTTAGEVVEPFDTVRVDANNRELAISVCGFPIHNSDGKLLGCATVERDISERTQAADALKRALAEAEEANQAKSSFLANVSHELRTPMNAIMGMTALALEEELTPVLRDYLETISESADALLVLLNDVLDLSKFGSGQFEIDSEPFDLSEVIENSIRSVSASAHTKGLELAFHIPTALPDRFVSDPIRLRQVITNLVSNAVKFTESGEVLVNVAGEPAGPASWKLRFSVRDTGIGISAEDQQRIFSAFTQVDESSTRRFGGTGLGLTISRHLIHRLGGKLSVKSEVGSGSTFQFELTLPVAADANQDTSALEMATRQFRDLNVLVVDDNKTSRTILSELLKGWEMKPTPAKDGSEGLEILREAVRDDKPYDLVLIDALMPGMNGFDMAEAISRSGELPTKTILMASTIDRLEFSELCKETGAAAIVEKPVSQSQLLDAMINATDTPVLQIDHATDKSLLSTPAIQKLNILLVEDTPANRKVVCSVLERRGHNITHAANGREAVDLFHKEAFHLVLMDVQMPIMDGLQSTEMIRNLERDRGTKRVPIIAMTAHSLKGDRERCLAAGMDQYISKPIDVTELIEKVENSVREVPHSIGPTKKPVNMSTSDKANSSVTINFDNALKRIRGDMELLRDMIQFFLEDYSGLVDDCKRAASASELPELQRSAHSLKGIAANIDATDLTSKALAIETAASEGRVATPEELADLEQTSHELAAVLQNYLAE